MRIVNERSFTAIEFVEDQVWSPGYGDYIAKVAFYDLSELMELVGDLATRDEWNDLVFNDIPIEIDEDRARGFLEEYCELAGYILNPSARDTLFYGVVNCPVCSESNEVEPDAHYTYCVGCNERIGIEAI